MPTLECTAPYETEVTLDGSASFDPDDDALEFRWIFEGIEFSSDPTAILLLEPGIHTVTLVVTDESGASHSDEVVVTAHDTTPPVITLVGASELTLECSIDTYVESGASVTDACDSTVTVAIGGDTVDAAVPGVYTVTYNATDSSGNVAVEVARIVTVHDTTPPVITLVGASEILLCQGDAFIDPGAEANDSCAGDLTAGIIADSDVNPNASGRYTVTYNVSDPSGNAADEVTRIVVVNAPPVPDTGGPYVVDEGGSVNLVGSATDEDDDVSTLIYAWDLDGDGTFESEGASQLFDASLIDGPETVNIAMQVIDERGCSAVEFTTVEVINVAPAIESLSATVEPVALGGVVDTFVDCSDPAADDTHTVDWDWGDGSSSETTSGGCEGMAGSHVYNAAGVYRVTATVTDDDGGVDAEIFEYVVVYDPAGGFITGGGHIESPLGAYLPDAGLSGKATFGFVSKYQKGATVPTGNTQFNFKVAGLNFKSTSYDWLVIAGAKAKYKGYGTINGSGSYQFLLSAIDGDASNGGGIDKFRIKIWDQINGGVVYDNAFGAAEDADPPTAISGGSIVVHKVKGKK